ncbi:MAG TPA: outer membrane lipoprotein carrier protein LolA [Mucilaginibacter sp.]|nr:outer membrane lipoprotein carrier protein LolA [Mucilaginibacter sp.]
MKKPIISILLIILTYTIAFAQKDKDAAKIMHAVALKYKTYNIIKADFSFKIDDPVANMRDTQTGTVIAQPKANKFRVIINDPTDKTGVAQEIISDGKSQWTYVKKNKETDLSDVDHSDNNISPAQLFTFYEHGYKYLYTGDYNIDGRVCQSIDLSPEAANTPFFKIRLSIDKVKKQIYSALIFDKSGARYTYTITSFTPNVKLPENIFTYDKKEHPGVEIVDLR